MSTCDSSPAATSAPVAMARQDDGRFVLATSEAKAGDRYLYVIDGERAVPDPASRWQPDDVHGPSLIVDPAAFAWTDTDWRGRAWEETALYELHVGTFTPAGTFAAVEGKLGHIAALGVTAIELMPLAEAPGARNWGYDGVYPFAPEARYGTPGDLKALIVAAHRHGLMVFLDVVYNHFGPEGNYLHASAPQFFTARHHTPWGAALNFDDAASVAVRDFFVHNALYWIEEFNVDGLRLDAVHTILDDSRRHVLEEIAQAVARDATRPTHLVLENDDNAAWLLARDRAGRPRCHTAQWNDDTHHALHVLLTGERQAYYGDYADDPAAHLARALVEASRTRARPRPIATGRAASAARICRRRPSSTSCRTTTRSATGRAASASRHSRRGGGARRDGDRAAGTLAAPPVHGRGMGQHPAVPVLLRVRAGAG
jgi:malto-oligosyltrehalose trehalohydrolase